LLITKQIETATPLSFGDLDHQSQFSENSRNLSCSESFNHIID
jgi:hypothetical protein